MMRHDHPVLNRGVQDPVICTAGFGTPVAFDLDGDGAELVEKSASRVKFDLNGDAARERTGWIGRDDGILVLDRDGSGRIDAGNEISILGDFDGAGSDLEDFYKFDTNSDGFLDANDDSFGFFQVWQDRNQNGKSEKKELYSLAELGIVRLSLEHTSRVALNGDDKSNQVIGLSYYEKAGGEIGELADVALYAGCGCGGNAGGAVMPDQLFESVRNLMWNGDWALV